MMISVRDANGNTKNAVMATAMIAGITSIGRSKNTLILQFTPAGEISVLDMMAGKAIRRNTLKSVYNFSDDGFDGLSIRAESNVLTREHFDACVTQLLDKDNMLAVLKPTKNERYRDVQSAEIFSNILNGAKSVYEYIYVILPSDKEDKKLVSMVKEYTDEDLIIIPQGPKVDVQTDKKTKLVVINYEPASKYSISSMKNAYGVKQLYTIPYNVSCRDARISEALLDYLLLNRKDMRTDDNYVLFSSLNTLVSRYVTNKEEDDDEEPEVKEQPEKGGMEPDDQFELPEDAIQEVIVKKGLFRKKEKKIMINL